MALTVKVGSAVESEGKKGVAHLLEHLLMSFLTFDLYDDVKYRAKAYTNFNETIFYIKCPADELNLIKTLKIIFEIAQGKFVAEKYFQRAKTDVLNEIREVQKKQTIISILLKQSGYSECLALGNEDDVLKLEYKDAKVFFEQYYSANIMSLAIVGDVPASIKTYVKALFTNLRSFPNTFVRKKYFIPDYKNKIEYIKKIKKIWIMVT